MPRTAVALALLTASGTMPLPAALLGWDWYLDGPPAVVLAVLAGYAAGAWLPTRRAVAGVLGVAAALLVANQLHSDEYHWLDDLVFFLVVVGGPAAAGAAARTRAQQVRRLSGLRAELEELQRIEVAAARLDEQGRVLGEVHAGIAEQVAAIAIRAEGALPTADAAALAAIEDEARSVLDRLRTTLGSMRQEAGTAAAPPPLPPGSSGPALPAGPSKSSGPAEPAGRLTVVDVLVPAVLGIAMAIETAVVSAGRGPWWANAVASLAVVAPLVARRRHPVAAAGASVTAGVLMSSVLTPIPETVTGVGLLVVLFYSVGAWCRSWWWLVGWVVAAGGALAMEQVARGGGPAGGDEVWIVLLWTVGAVAVGRVTAGWQERVRRTAETVTALEHGRGAAVRLAVGQQREALAGELHDTVAHAMTAVCLQAAAARSGDAEQRAAALGLIVSVAETSLVELREGLEAMEHAANPLDPSHLRALGRRVGVEVRARTDEAGSGPAAALAHRVIREAVVNVARHAPGAPADVRVSRCGGALAVEVVDEGSARGSVLEGTGTGLRSLAETVGSVGGSLEWGRRDQGGFRVAALIPEEQP